MEFIPISHNKWPRLINNRQTWKNWQKSPISQQIIEVEVGHTNVIDKINNFLTHSFPVLCKRIKSIHQYLQIDISLVIIDLILVSLSWRHAFQHTQSESSCYGFFFFLPQPINRFETKAKQQLYLFISLKHIVKNSLSLRGQCSSMTRCSHSGRWYYQGYHQWNR